MSLLKAFKNYFISSKAGGNAISRSRKYDYAESIKVFNRVNSLNDIPIQTAFDNDQLVQKNLDNIEKNFKFQRKLVKEYLEPLNDTKLRRSKDLNSKFDKDKAKVNYQLTQFLKNNEGDQDTVYHTINQHITTEIIKTLSCITPKPSSAKDPSRIAINDTELFYNSPLHNHVYNEIPKLPNFEKDPKRFEQYIYLLTHSTFHYKNSSKFNGIIPKILRNLFHPLNSNTLNIRTINSYNYLIHFFSTKSDFATCREIFVQMSTEKIKPNATTYNLMIKNAMLISNLPHLSNPMNITLKYLRKMRNAEVDADVVTWNLVFKILKDNISKESLLRKRSELNIPLDPYFTKEFVRHLIDDKKKSAYEVFGFIKELNISFDKELFNLFLKQLIKESQYEAAFRSSKSLPESYQFKLNTESLNLYLRKFSQQGRVDLVIGMINTFGKKFGIKPNIDSYNLIMKSLAVSGSWPMKKTVSRILYYDMISSCKGIIAGDYWLKRLRARFKFIHNSNLDFRQPLTLKEVELRKLIHDYSFEEKIEFFPNKENKKILGKLGFYATKSKKNQQFDNPKLAIKKQQMKKYKIKISNIAIQKSMINRVPYANDPYTALKEELSNRRIIDKPI